MAATDLSFREVEEQNELAGRKPQEGPESQTESDHEEKSRLIHGTQMTCPRCEVDRNILDFQRMDDGDPKYAHELAPVYKCPRQRGGCGMFFAPSDHAVVQNLVPDRVNPEEVNFE